MISLATARELLDFAGGGNGSVKELQHELEGEYAAWSGSLTLPLQSSFTASVSAVPVPAPS